MSYLHRRCFSPFKMALGDINNSSDCPLMVFSNHSCASGFTKLDTGTSPSYVAIVSCTFSILGSILIILTFFVLKDLQTTSQKIVTLLALADLISAVGYIIGSANYLRHRNMTVADTGACDTFSRLCMGQAAVTSYSSLVSFLWTVILAFHFFVIIVFKTKMVSNVMVVYHVIAWGGPLSVVVPLLALKKLGYAHSAASNWCFVKDTGSQPLWQTTLLILVAGKFWEILSYIVVTFLCIVITVFISKVRDLVRAYPQDVYPIIYLMATIHPPQTCDQCYANSPVLVDVDIVYVGIVSCPHKVIENSLCSMLRPAGTTTIYLGNHMPLVMQLLCTSHRQDVVFLWPNNKYYPPPPDQATGEEHYHGTPCGERRDTPSSHPYNLHLAPDVGHLAVHLLHCYRRQE